MKDDKKGVVNRGFTEESSSENDDSVLVFESKEPTHIPKKCVCQNVIESGEEGCAEEKDRKVIGAGDSLTGVNHENFRGHLLSEAETNKGQSAPSSEPSTLHDFVQGQNEENRRRSCCSGSINLDKNVQSITMFPETATAPSVQAAYTTFPNGEAIISQPSESNRQENVTKDYYRDVRLSLDLTINKPISTDPEQFHKYSIDRTKRSSYCTKCSAYRGDDDNFDEGESDGDCDSCKRTILNHYKFVFKYVLERPLFCFCVWAVFYIYWGDSALPGGSLFALTVLEITALCLGYVAEVLQMPGLLGMLAAGIILRNVPYIDVANDLDSTLSSSLRGISVVILLVRGALGVNPPNIVKYKNVVVPLVIGSCALEAIAATLSVYLIIGFPLEWASLMGCIMSAMSGVAVLPYIGPTEKHLSLKVDPNSASPNYQKVFAIVRTACGLDAMIAICMAEVALGFIFAEGDVGGGFVKGVVEIIIGGAFGLLWGFVAAILLDKSSSIEMRVATVFCCGVMSLIGLTKIGYPRGGPLACFAGVLIASTIWKRKKIGGANNEQLSTFYTLTWFFLQPLLFSIIGTRTDFEIVDWGVVLKGLICLAISLSVRFITSFLMTFSGNLTLKERIYLCIAWLPKGTVQAALGPVALDTTLSSTGLIAPKDYEDLSNKVMNISAATVIIAPILGCFLLRFIAPHLLSRR